MARLCANTKISGGGAYFCILGHLSRCIPPFFRDAPHFGPSRSRCINTFLGPFSGLYTCSGGLAEQVYSQKLGVFLYTRSGALGRFPSRNTPETPVRGVDFRGSVGCGGSPQVVSKFVDHVQEAELMNPGTGGDKERENQAARQVAWLKRDSNEVSGGAKQDWRPKKKHRVSARNWALHLDNQVGCRCHKGVGC